MTERPDFEAEPPAWRDGVCKMEVLAKLQEGSLEDDCDVEVLLDRARDLEARS